MLEVFNVDFTLIRDEWMLEMLISLYQFVGDTTRKEQCMHLLINLHQQNKIVATRSRHVRATILHDLYKFVECGEWIKTAQ